MKGRRECEWATDSAGRTLCINCGWEWRRAGPPPRRNCSLNARDHSAPVVRPLAPQPRLGEKELAVLRQSLLDRHTLGLATIAWEETERRLAICARCHDIALAGDNVETRCSLSSGCGGDAGHKLRITLTTNERTCPARRFDVPPGASKIAICTCYFNPAGYQTRRANFKLFADAAISQGAELWVAEAGTPGQWEVEERPGLRVERLEWRDALWQKERLLNWLIDRLPDDYRYVAWVDGDILFDDPSWIANARLCLRQHRICQLFTAAHWLNRYLVPERWWHKGPIERLSVPRAYELSKAQVNFGQGHPGFAWAARREVLREVGGLYDRHILGSGDTIMALGWYGWKDHVYLDRFTGPFKAAATRWVERTGRIVRGDVGYIPGNIRHLWHGERINRDYDGRILRAAINLFDPDDHLVLDESGLWAWSPSTPQAMKDTAREYFDTRREDG